MIRYFAAAIPLAALAAPDFDRDIAPVLARHCLQCHGETVRMAGLDLRTTESMAKGGSKGSALKPGRAEDSLLLQRILDQSMPMGPKKVAPGEAKLLREWIDAGAPSGSGTLARASTRHWAFEPASRPAVPATTAPWAQTPVDAFLASAMAAKGIRAVQPASKPVWLRRVYLGLIGLPPTPAEQDAFLKDSSSAAYDTVIEDLLNRPQYGERWARRWLDVVRYAESNGYERDGTKPNVWRYRDWVINAFNQDKPYDRFVHEQIAGDEIEGSNADTQIAATFLRLGTWDDEPAEPLQDRYDQLDDVLGSTSAAFLGVTLRCARCHDHKFEPFTQQDYYRTLAVFTPLKRPQEGRTESDRLVGTAPELAAYNASKQRADSEVAELDRKIERTRQDVIRQLLKNRAKNKIEPDLAFLDHVETVLAFSTPAAQRNKQQKKLVNEFQERLDKVVLAQAEERERASIIAWRAEKDTVNASRMPEPPRAYIWTEEDTPPATRLLVRGDPNRPGAEVEPGVPAVLGKPGAEAVRARSTSGRRLWFARWMTSESNPLTARVIVNRVWQGHFGEGLVPSENDFGVAGQRPVNQALLDYLATELVRSGWSLKHIQRLITRSGVYQLSSGWDAAAGKTDPDNTLLWRWKPRRIDAEIARDSMLAVSGSLNSNMLGPSVFPTLPESVLAGQSQPGLGWGKSDKAEVSRRSVYIFVKRSLAVPELEALDAPDTTASCEQRVVSTTGPQALVFLNGAFAHEQAKHLASRVQRESGADTREQIRLLYRYVLSRPPTAEESADAAAFIGKQADGLQAFAVVLLNSNEFFYWM
ncbi:MAG: DUF1553 domain-containing protein [Acidobacteria bacterium]|nr:DUF1553 domain-containing protein [Acidobacteriota bacterium]